MCRHTHATNQYRWDVVHKKKKHVVLLLRAIFANQWLSKEKWDNAKTNYTEGCNEIGYRGCQAPL